MQLQSPGMRWQLKSALNVLQHAHSHGRLTGLSNLSASAARLARPQEPAVPVPHIPAGGVLAASAEDTMAGADMGRAGMAPTLAARLLFQLLPEQPIVQQRRANFTRWHGALAGAPGGRALVPALPELCAPYVYPFWVEGAERADHVYAALRLARLPVFRWDRVWPGTPADPADTGMHWSRQVLQLLCHQSLRQGDIERSAQVLHQALQAH